MNTDWVSGNRITLLENGEAYYPRVFEAIGAARKEVLLETFILFDDKVGRGLQEVLIQAATRGAKVHVLLDGWGSPDLSAAFTQPLLDAGVKLRSFEPVQRIFGARINMLRRMHRKLVVVDAQVAFVGGINYSIDHLAENGPLAKQDYAVEIEGPLVGHVRAFCQACLEGPQPARRQWLRRWPTGLRRRGDAGAGVAGNSGNGDNGDNRDNRDNADASGAWAAFVTRDNSNHRTDIERHYRGAIHNARDYILIANAYFFPGYRLLRDLRRAARRGVRVDLILQGQPDLAWARHAAQLLYEYLGRAGIRIHEYVERPLHGKVAVIDDRWATVGSSNLDPTSLGLNLEANVMVRDPAFARHLRERLEHLLQQHCEEIELPTTGPLRSGWIAVRSAAVFHALRYFSIWARLAPVRAPRVVALQVEPE